MPLNFDPYNPDHYARLRRVRKYNYREMKPFREVRRLNIDAARGHYYNTKDDPPDSVRDPVNMMDQFKQILVRSLVQGNPACRVSSRSNPEVARIFHEYLNETIQELNLRDTLRQCVEEAIMGYIGIAYVTVTPTENDRAGEVSVDSVSLPNLVLDLGRDDFTKIDLIGHRFSRRVGELRDNPLYDQELVGRLSPRRSGLSELDDGGADREEYDEDEGSLFDWVDLWALVIPPAQLVVYMSEDQTIDAPLRVETLDAPEFGPYARLRFDNVLDELMPNSRAAMMLDLHEFVNSQYRRIFMKEDQAAEFFTYEGGAEQDARAVRDAMDSELVQVNNNAAVQRRLKGGTNPQALATAIHSRQLFDEASGHLRVLGGVGPVAETATQERLANVNISRLVKDMQLEVVRFTTQVLRMIAWHEWTHRTRTQKVQLKVGQGGRAVSRMWSPEIRQGDFVEYEIDIVPDSMEHRSSAEQLEHLVRAVQGMVIPLSQMPTTRPVVLKVPEFLKKYAELDRLPELAEVADYASDEAFVAKGAAAPAAPQTPSRPEGTQGARAVSRSPEDGLMERMLAGAGQRAPGEET